MASMLARASLLDFMSLCWSKYLFAMEILSTACHAIKYINTHNPRDMASYIKKLRSNVFEAHCTGIVDDAAIFSGQTKILVGLLYFIDC